MQFSYYENVSYGSDKQAEKKELSRAKDKFSSPPSSLIWKKKQKNCRNTKKYLTLELLFFFN